MMCLLLDALLGSFAIAFAPSLSPKISTLVPVRSDCRNTNTALVNNDYMVFSRVPQMVVTLGQQYNVGEKPTVIPAVHLYGVLITMHSHQS